MVYLSFYGSGDEKWYDWQIFSTGIRHVYQILGAEARPECPSLLNLDLDWPADPCVLGLITLSDSSADLLAWVY
jgi:hypothetical protein